MKPIISNSQIDTGLAIAEIADGRTEVLRAIQGYLLQENMNGREVSPRTIASEVGLTPEASRDLCRQLVSFGAAEQLSAPSDPLNSTYQCSKEVVSSLCETAVFATRILKRNKERTQPSTDVQPLATLPADPSFDEVTPQDFGFEWLMPRLSNSINQTKEKIHILMPFFETDGFTKLEPALIAALERGVEISIVGRYLSDRTSHNRKVLSAFVERCQEQGVPLTGLSMIDYTVWESDDDSGQNGDQPSFTLHAKVMIFDGKSAYIGSANVTDYGFERYLELGVLLNGPTVTSFDQLVSRLLESPAATEVQLS
jgi:putative cardiolipin synthase